MELIYKKRFKKSLKNLNERHPKIYLKIENVLEDFLENLFESKFFRKNFQYKGIKITELEFWWDYRILLEVIIEDDKIILLNIWTHSSLELSWNKNIKI